jgi:hypothetical protein
MAKTKTSGKMRAGIAKAPQWPSLKEQFAAVKVVPGSALEKLIKDNQDFQASRPTKST